MQTLRRPSVGFRGSLFALRKSVSISPDTESGRRQNASASVIYGAPDATFRLHSSMSLFVHSMYGVIILVVCLKQTSGSNTF